MKTEEMCNLDLSKRLNELEIKQESLFYWVKIENRSGYHLALRKDCYGGYEYIFLEPVYSHTADDIEEVISAFTVAELGKLLPKNIDNYDRDLSIMFDGNLVKVHYCDYTTHKSTPIIMDNSEANARAKMLIWLIENNKK